LTCKNDFVMDCKVVRPAATKKNTNGNIFYIV
jgi:hypothetical protein